jgi:phospholipase/lecithinase/hemolysin
MLERHISAYINKEGVQGVVEDFIGLQIDLYNAGARNFLLIDLPTIHRTPAGKKHPY